MRITVPFITRLRDGTEVKIREIGPEDRRLLREGFAHLSQESRFMRFLSAHGNLTEEELDRFTAKNTNDRFAIGAISNDGPLATARFFRINDSTRAELAVTIIDPWQRRGLGGVLMQALKDAAIDRGITDLIALVHSGNTGMRSLLDRQNARIIGNEDGEIEYEIALDLEHLKKSA